LKVVFSPHAIDDLRTFAARGIADDPRAAVKMIDRIFRVVLRLARGDFEGPERRLRSGQMVRSWPVHSLRIHYRRTDALHVLRVYRHARRPIAT